MVLLSLTRLVTPPLAVVVLVHAVVRYRNRAKDPIRRAEWVGMALLAVVASASISLWSTIANAITNGVKATGADRGSVSNAVGVGRFGWFTNAYEHIGWIGVLGLGLLVVLFVVVALSRLTRTWGVECGPGSRSTRSSCSFYRRGRARRDVSVSPACIPVGTADGWKP